MKRIYNCLKINIPYRKEPVKKTTPANPIMTSLGNQSKLLNDIFLLDKHW